MVEAGVREKINKITTSPSIFHRIVTVRKETHCVHEALYRRASRENDMYGQALAWNQPWDSTAGNGEIYATDITGWNPMLFVIYQKGGTTFIEKRHARLYTKESDVIAEKADFSRCPDL
jgi:hypothetical protein